MSRKKPNDRFDAKVDKSSENGCHIWIGGKVAGGYGHFRLNKKMISAHRYSFIRTKGPIPDGMMVCHSCYNNSCVNPEHLFVDTHANNMKRMKEDGRLAKGENHGASKLNDAKVKYVRKLYREGLSIKDIAKMHNVNPVTISKVISGQRWSHVTD